MNVIIIHGYSSNAESIRKSLGTTLLAANDKRGSAKIPGLQLHYADYVSLDDQVQLEDVAEALYIELQSKGFLKGAGRTLRFVVHSTGGLVIRQLLRQYDWAGIKERVASIVFVAPANFGSPLAAKGKSQLGRLKTIIVDQLFGQDNYVSELQFGEVGEQILTDLEIAAPRQWELTDFDLFHETLGCIYQPDTIRTAVFVGANNDGTPAKLIANLDGTDGVVMTSGAGLNVRRLLLDLVSTGNNRPSEVGWTSGTRPAQLPSVPQVVINDLNHGTILTDSQVAGLILDVLSSTSAKEFESVAAKCDSEAKQRNGSAIEQFQQFVLRVTDDRNKPVTDYDVSLTAWSYDTLKALNIIPVLGKPLVDSGDIKAITHALLHDHSEKLDRFIREHAYAHSKSKEYRRFLVDYDLVQTLIEDKKHVLTMSIIAYSGDNRIHYAAGHTKHIVIHTPESNGLPALFYPNTTTQIRVVLDRFSDADTIVSVKPPL